MGRLFPRVGTDKPATTNSLCAFGLLILCLLMFLSGSVFAQTGRTTISGRVLDPSGAVVPGAKVVVTNVGTNFEVSLVTNEKGYYEAGQLLPGQYKIAAEAAGFGKLLRQGITLVASTPISVELKLEVGKAEQTMVVTADVPLVNTDPNSGGQVVTQELIDNAPVSGANATLLTKYTSNVVTQYPANWYMAGNLNATGNTSNIGTAGTINKNEYYIDGAPNESYAHNMAYVPSTDEISEMKTETSGFDASLGKTLGVSLVQTSKAGTNQFHGGVREMYYDRRWEAMSHFASGTYAIQKYKNCSDPSSAACATAKAKYGNPGVIEHNSGVNFGGPVYIPKVFNGKDKLFFFLNINRDPYNDIAYQTATVPTAQQRLGDFSDLCTGGNCGSYQIYNPLSVVPKTVVDGTGKSIANYQRSPVPGNNLNNVPALAALMNSNQLAKFVNQYYPLPNISSNGNYAISNNYQYTQMKPAIYKSYLLRTDYTPSQKDRVFVRLSKSFWNQNVDGLLNNNLDALSAVFDSRIMSVGWTRMFSNALMIDTTLGYSGWYYIFDRPNEAKISASQVGLPSYVDAMAQSAWRTQMPFVSLGGSYTTFGQTPTPKDEQRHIALRSGLSYIKGNHSFKFGGEVRQQMRAAQAGANTSGLLTFNNSYTRQYDTTSDGPQSLGLSYAAFLLGMPSTTQYDIPAKYKDTNPYFGLYFQDTWRVSPKLTISPGLRYEYEFGIQDALNRMVTYWNPNASQPVDLTSALAAGWSAQYNTIKAAFPSGSGIPAYPALATAIPLAGGNTYAGVNGASRRMFDNNWRLMPRIGFAYQVTPTMVLRGGYGLFYDTANATLQSPNQNGFSRSTVDTISDNYGQTWKMGDPANGVSPLTNPFYVQASGARYLTPVGSALGSSMYVGSSYGSSSSPYYPRNYHPARQQRWQAEFQKQLGTRDALTVGYTGSYTDQLDWAQNINAIPSSYYTGGTTPNPNYAALSAQVANPFNISNFAALKTSNPALYNQMSSLQTFSAANVSLISLTRPIPWMGDIYQQTNKGATKYHAVTTQFNHRFSKNFQATVNYQRTWQYDKNFTANSFDTQPTWQITDLSRPSRLTLMGSMTLPFGKGQRFLQSGILSRIFGGETIDFNYEAQQGIPCNFGNMIYTGDPKNLKSVMLDHPQYVLDLAKGSNYVQWLNPAVIDTVASHQLNSLNVRQFPNRIDGVRSQGINNFSASYQKTFNIREGLKFSGRFDAVDLFNHRTLWIPNDNNPTSSTYGRVTSNYGEYGRWIQIQGKITF